MAAGPKEARIGGNWSRCSRVKAMTERSDMSNGPIARAPYCGKAFRARSWIDSCGLQKSAIVSARRFPWRIDAKICCSKTNVKNVWNDAKRVEAGHAACRTY